MSKIHPRKKFGIASDIAQAMADVVNAVDNNSGKYRYEIVALKRIEIDPENSRELLLLPQDIEQGINKDDPHAVRKKTEKHALESLAHTIKEQGVINPIFLYKFGEKYRLITGERRFLASALAGKTDIPAKVLNEKPHFLDLRILQWVENNERENLSLGERIKNLNQIITEVRKKTPNEKINGEKLKELTGLSVTQAYSYLSVINGDKAILENVISGKINSLDKTVLLVGIKEDTLRQKALSLCLSGESLENIKKFINLEKALKKENRTTIQKKQGRATQSVNLGKIKNTGTVKKIIDIILGQPSFRQFTNHFEKIDWNNCDQVTVGFKKIIEIIEKV